MSPISSFTAVAVLLAAAANAHFTLDYPSTIGFDDDLESTEPCGGFTPDFSTDNITDFYVDGDNIALNLLHSQGTWLFRATLDETASGNWTQIFPEALQSGLGRFCEPSVTVPSGWAGSNGVISVAVDAPDGILYQCAAVKFVSGAATTQQSTCTNSSSVTVAFSDDSNLASLLNSTSSSTASGTAATTASSTGSSTASSAATTSAKSAAAGRMGGSPSLGSAVAAVGLAVLGSAYMLL